MPVIRTATLEGAAKAGGHSSKTIGRGWVVESANGVCFPSLMKVLYTTHARMQTLKVLRGAQLMQNMLGTGERVGVVMRNIDGPRTGVVCSRAKKFWAKNRSRDACGSSTRRWSMVRLTAPRLTWSAFYWYCVQSASACTG